MNWNLAVAGADLFCLIWPRRCLALRRGKPPGRSAREKWNWPGQDTATPSASRSLKKLLPGRHGFTDPWLPGELRAVGPSLLRTYHRAAIEFGGDSEGDFPGSGGGQDIVVRQELSGRVAGSERNLHFLPQRVEAVTLDRIQHTDERLAARQSGIGHINGVDRAIIPDIGLFTTGGQFHEIDGKQFAVVEGGHVPSGAIVVGGHGGAVEGERQSQRRERSKDICLHRSFFRVSSELLLFPGLNYRGQL